MKIQNKRRKVQAALGTIIVFTFFFSENMTLFISSYLTLTYVFLEMFHFIKTKESEDVDNVKSDDKHFLSQTITFVIFQLLSFGAILGLTWVLLHWKLKLI